MTVRRGPGRATVSPPPKGGTVRNWSPAGLNRTYITRSPVGAKTGLFGKSNVLSGSFLAMPGYAGEIFFRAPPSGRIRQMSGVSPGSVLSWESKTIAEPSGAQSAAEALSPHGVSRLAFAFPSARLMKIADSHFRGSPL